MYSHPGVPNPRYEREMKQLFHRQVIDRKPLRGMDQSGQCPGVTHDLWYETTELGGFRANGLRVPMRTLSMTVHRLSSNYTHVFTIGSLNAWNATLLHSQWAKTNCSTDNLLHMQDQCYTDNGTDLQHSSSGVQRTCMQNTQYARGTIWITIMSTLKHISKPP